MMRPARRGGAAGREDGTRFRLYPAYDDGFRNPECILLSPPAGSLEPGPSDMRMYTVNPLCKDAPYDPPFYEPPYRGPQHAPACPDPAGQFDRIPIDSQQFLAAHTYGAVRRTLDIWEAYLGRPVTWWHAAFLPQLELVARVEWANAHSGPGYLEMGRQADETGRLAPFCLNYDVLAHETGHAILFSQVGIPPESSVTREFLAFHESFADLIGLVGTMHFRSIIGQLLTETAGNLYIENVISRLGEISRTEQIRVADNLATMDDVADLRLAPDGGWIDPTGLDRNQHAIAEPLTGAIFDNIVEFYQDDLVAMGLVPQAADPRGWTVEAVARASGYLRIASARSFTRFAAEFESALHRARDLVGHCMAHVILTVRPETLSFAGVAARFLEAAAAQGQAHILPALLENFLWRGIDPRPHLLMEVARGAPRSRRRRPGRLFVAESPNRTRGCDCGNLHGFLRAGRLMTHPHRAQLVKPE
jgi:hypothetical protein